jgi:hypothetical protein
MPMHEGSLVRGKAKRYGCESGHRSRDSDRRAATRKRRDARKCVARRSVNGQPILAVAFRQPHAAYVEAGGERDKRFASRELSDNDLRASASNIEDSDLLARVRCESAKGAAKRESSLFDSTQDARVDAQERMHAVLQLSTAFGVAHCARADDAYSLGLKVAQGASIRFDTGQRALDRSAGESMCAIDVLTQPRNGRALRDGQERSIGLSIGDE